MIAPVQQPKAATSVDRRIDRVRGARAFTLVEWLLVMALISILLTISAYTFRNVQESGAMAQAKNAVITYLGIARSYAIENHIETIMAVNPYNGRFEVWHMNPPVHGGPWDPFSGGTVAPFTDGFAFAPVLDKAAALPVDSTGRPSVTIFPVDYDDPAYRPTANNDQNIDNLIWTMFCFDENGRMVTRTRRIATLSYRRYDGSIRPAGQRNRLPDETPDLSLRGQAPPAPLVTGNDTAVTSTRGFVICDWTRAEKIVGSAPAPTDLVNNLLRETRAGRPYSHLATTVLLDRYSGQELVGDSK